MVTVWWSTAGAIHYNFLQPGQIITTESYSPILPIDEMYRKLRQHQPARVNRRGRILLHDNAPFARFTNHRSKVKQIECRSSTSLTILSRPLANRLPSSITFSPVEPSSITTRQKCPSSTSSNPEDPIFMPMELIDLYYVGKSALIRMAPISIKLNKYSLRYDSLK